MERVVEPGAVVAGWHLRPGAAGAEGRQPRIAREYGFLPVGTRYDGGNGRLRDEATGAGKVL